MWAHLIHPYDDGEDDRRQPLLVMKDGGSDDDDDDDDHQIGGDVNTENGDEDEMKQKELPLFGSVW